MEPKEYDIEFTRGDTCPISFELKSYNEETLILDSSTDEVYFTVKKNYSTKEYVLQKKFSKGEIIQEDGICSLVLEHEDTANLKYGKYVYDIQVKSGSYVHTAVIGEINLTNESTYISNE